MKKKKKNWRRRRGSRRRIGEDEEEEEKEGEEEEEEEEEEGRRGKNNIDTKPRSICSGQMEIPSSKLERKIHIFNYICFFKKIWPQSTLEI